MIKERYVSFEVAKLLRDKGFDEPCARYYNPIGKLNFLTLTVTETNSGWVDNVSAPTQAVACDWVEETFNINIVVYVCINGYLICICHAHKVPNIASNGIQDDMPDGDNSDGSWSSKELAYNAALKYVLTNLV